MDLGIARLEILKAKQTLSKLLWQAIAFTDKQRFEGKA